MQIKITSIRWYKSFIAELLKMLGCPGGVPMANYGELRSCVGPDSP